MRLNKLSLEKAWVCEQLKSISVFYQYTSPLSEHHCFLFLYLYFYVPPSPPSPPSPLSPPSLACFRVPVFVSYQGPRSNAGPIWEAPPSSQLDHTDGSIVPLIQLC